MYISLISDFTERERDWLRTEVDLIADVDTDDLFFDFFFDLVDTVFFFLASLVSVFSS